ncbi:arsenate reductase (glutaredoxin) [Nioella sp. MMSF_3534]|jgi:arsenate reductase|uniref:arsenate reductase (glutaredoxin) n=1 Tax=Nioella sp. MMSF_3534 TaxID=3046720 RepID=UPI00273E6A02|nr:arsenate reductase (glutaredoxin) [Nioella sp. MMSF_3534]
MHVTIYHNPRCSKSRQTLELIRAAGVEPEIVEYLKTGWTEAVLSDLFTKAGIAPRDALRLKQDPAPELGLAKADDATIMAAMITHPVLVERPIVVVGDQAAICRPPERVHEVLDKV